MQHKNLTIQPNEKRPPLRTFLYSCQQLTRKQDFFEINNYYCYNLKSINNQPFLIFSYHVLIGILIHGKPVQFISSFKLQFQHTSTSTTSKFICIKKNKLNNFSRVLEIDLGGYQLSPQTS